MNMNQFSQNKYENNVNTLYANNHCRRNDLINEKIKPGY